MSNVFDITDRYLHLLQELEEAEGELTPELESQLVGIKEEIEERLTAYRYFIKYKEADIDLLKGMIEEYKEKIKYAENAIERVKKIVAMVLNNFGDDNKSGNKSYKCATFTVWNQPVKSVLITDEFANFNQHPGNEKYGVYMVNTLVPVNIHSKFVKELDASIFKKADEFVPDKKAIAEAIKEREENPALELPEIKGASIVTKDSIRFK